jgi:hypothetical protein
MFSRRLQVDFIKCQPLKIAVHVVRDGKRNLADLRVPHVPAVLVVLAVVQTDQPQAAVVRHTDKVMVQVVVVRQQIAVIAESVRLMAVVIQQVVLQQVVAVQVVAVRQQIVVIVVSVRLIAVVIQRVVRQRVVAVHQRVVAVQIPAVRSVMMIAQ